MFGISSFFFFRVLQHPQLNMTRLIVKTLMRGMIETYINKISSKDYRILSGSALKMLAMFIMVLDHSARYVLAGNDFFTTPFLSVGSHDITLLFLMKFIGRLGFPIFAFLIVEGFLHTHNRFKYGRNLLLFALISEIPWNLIHGGAIFYPTQNVFFTLFLGYLGLCAIVSYKDNLIRQGVCLFSLLILSIVLHADYGCSGFGFILMLYMLREHKIWQAIIGCCFLSSRWIAGLAFIPLNMYNGKRGFVQGKVAKYSFYVFYPLHLLILWWIKAYLMH